MMTDDNKGNTYTEPHEWYGLSDEAMERILCALDEEDNQSLSALCQGLHPADVADAIENLYPDQRVLFITLLWGQLSPEVLAELYADIRYEVLQQLSDQDIAKALLQLNSDDALSVLQEMEEPRQEAVLTLLPPAERPKLREGLSYPEDSAGRLMQREMITVMETWTIDRVFTALRGTKKTHLLESFSEIFVVNKHHQPVGKLKVGILFQQQEEILVKDVMDRDINPVPVTLGQGEVGHMFRQYGLLTAPVTDHKGRLVGMVTVDDVVTVLEQTATENIMRLGGVGESDFYAGTLHTSLSRFRWLLVTFIDTLLASAVIYQFQDVLEKKVALAILMPIVAAMGGNAGMQVITVVVRALSTHDLHASRISSIIEKELKVALFNGLVFASLLATLTGFWFHDLQLGMILAAAMLFNILWAGLAGASLPIILHKMGFDPAISSGPLLTTTTDVLGFALFLGLARAVLG